MLGVSPVSLGCHIAALIDTYQVLRYPTMLAGRPLWGLFQLHRSIPDHGRSRIQDIPGSQAKAAEPSCPVEDEPRRVPLVRRDEASACGMP